MSEIKPTEPITEPPAEGDGDDSTVENPDPVEEIGEDDVEDAPEQDDPDDDDDDS